MMLNGMEFQTVGAAYLKALRPTAVLVNGTCRKLCDADHSYIAVCQKQHTATDVSADGLSLHQLTLRTVLLMDPADHR